MAFFLCSSQTIFFSKTLSGELKNIPLLHLFCIHKVILLIAGAFVDLKCIAGNICLLVCQIGVMLSSSCRGSAWNWRLSNFLFYVKCLICVVCKSLWIQQFAPKGLETADRCGTALLVGRGEHMGQQQRGWQILVSWPCRRGSQDGESWELVTSGSSRMTLLCLQGGFRGTQQQAPRLSRCQSKALQCSWSPPLEVSRPNGVKLWAAWSNPGAALLSAGWRRSLPRFLR